MKKKFRNITVDGKEYAWMSKLVDGQHTVLKIWYDKKVIYEKPIPEYLKAVTPRMVKYIIGKEIRKRECDGKNK